jgi:hypothetical protein
MLRGKIKIEHLGLELNILAFLRSSTQKRKQNEADIQLILPIEEEKQNPFD